MFEAYLGEHGYDTPEYEPDLGVAKRPDYLVRRNRHHVVCEVKEFDRDTMSTPDPPVGSTDLKTVLAPIRSQIRQAAKQLKPLSKSGTPLVAVITNPHGAMVQTGEREMVWAMYGDPVYNFQFDPSTGAAVGEGLFTVDRNGKLRGDHQYISALVVVREREYAVDFYDTLLQENSDLTADERLDAIFAARDSGQVPFGSYHRVDVFNTLSPSAVPLPDAFFNGPNDRVFGHDQDAQVYRQLRGRVFQ